MYVRLRLVRLRLASEATGLCVLGILATVIAATGGNHILLDTQALPMPWDAVFGSYGMLLMVLSPLMIPSCALCAWDHIRRNR